MHRWIPLVVVGCTPIAHKFEPREDFPIEEAADMVTPPDDPDTLKVMSWNVKFGGARIDFFFDGWGDRVHMSPGEVNRNLDGLYSVINEQNPDVLLLQEVDRSSKRSAYIDQAKGLLNNTDMNYLAWVPNWRADYIPEEGLGKVEMGQAVLSKYPITRNTRVDLPQSEDSSFVVNYFWLHRAVQLTTVDLGGGGELSVVNNHPSAYAQDGTKLKHLDIILEETQKMPEPMVCGGDFNVIPDGSLQTKHFADEAKTETTGVAEIEYTQEEMDSLQRFYDAWAPAIEQVDYQVDDLDVQAQFFSHSVSKDVFWTQKLDYLFTSEAWTDGHTLQKPDDGSPPTASDPMTLSDHAPLTAVLVLP